MSVSVDFNWIFVVSANENNMEQYGNITPYIG